MPENPPERRLTRGMLERLHFIDDALRRKQPLSCTTVQKEFGVSRKTALADVAYLRDRMNRPLETDRRRQCYYYDAEVDPLPDQVISEGELFTLMVARGALAPYRGTRFYSQLSQTADKIGRSLQTKVSFSAHDYASRMSFCGLGTPKIDPVVFDLVGRAIARCVEVTFDYRKPDDPAGSRRRLVQPWHIAQRGPLCYVIGYDREARGRRTFALPRIARPALTATRFTLPEDFSPESHFANAFCVLGGTGDHCIVVRFHGASAVRVQECEWHESERWRPLPGGSVELELRLGALEEIERWVLGWGGQAEVIEPAALRQRIATTIGALARVYREGD